MINFLNLKTPSSIKLFDPKDGITVASPPGKGPGYWAGATSVLYDKEIGKFYLYYRLRRPRLVENGKEIGRGYECIIAESTNGIDFKTVWRADKSFFGGISLEKASLIKTLDGIYRLYISYVDPEDNRWRIDMLGAKRIEYFNPAEKTKIFTPSELQIEGIKDPEVIIIGGLYYMFASYAPSPEKITPELKEKMHESADIYNTGITKSCTGLAISSDGINFRWIGDILSPPLKGWDAYAMRITSIIYSPPTFYAFYDGSRDVSENYEEKLGLTISLDLLRFERVTAEAPLIVSPYSSGSLRYLNVIPVDGKLYYYYEISIEDGSHELRVNIVES